MLEITPEFVLNFIKYSVVLVATWPPNSHAPKRLKIIFEIWWWFLLINLLFIIIPLLYSSITVRDDPLKRMKFLFFALNASQCVIKMIICKKKSATFQFLHEELQEYVSKSQSSEKRIFLKYIKAHSMIYLMIMFGALIAVISIITGALYQDQELPIDVNYPFKYEYRLTLKILYILQIINGFQVGSIVSIDTQVASLLWFSIARLHLLGHEIEFASDNFQLRSCIQKHQYLIRLINEMIGITRLLTLTTVIMCMLSIIFGSTHIFGDDLVMKFQCVSTAVVLTFILYMNAYPAEYLIHACENIGWSAWSAYNVSRKDTKSIGFNKCLIFIMHKSQRPSIIRIHGFIPRLSLDYYRAFLVKTFSFFTTLRIILLKMD